MCILVGGLIIGRIFASEIWAAYFRKGLFYCIYFYFLLYFIIIILFFFLVGGGGVINGIFWYLCKLEQFDNFVYILWVNV